MIGIANDQTKKPPVFPGVFCVMRFVSDPEKVIQGRDGSLSKARRRRPPSRTGRVLH